MEKFAQYSAMLSHAQKTLVQCQPITASDAEFSVDDAYAFSKLQIQRRLQSTGSKVVGRKIGITSPELQKMLGVSAPVYGYLTSDRKIDNGGSIPEASLIAPRAEGEVVFIFTKELHQANPTRDDIFSCSKVAMGIEIVDSRFKIPCRIQDIIADNSAAAHFIVNREQHDSSFLDFSTAKMTAKKNGAVALEGTGREVMGDPVHTVTWLAKAMAKSGEYLRSGDIVFSGSFTAMGMPFAVGDLVEIEIQGLGSAAFRYGS